MTHIDPAACTCEDAATCYPCAYGRHSDMTTVYYRLADGTKGSMALSRRDHSEAARVVSAQMHADDEYDFAILRVVDA